MYYLHIRINGELVGTTQHTTAPFVPRISDKIRVDGILYRVLEVVIEYTSSGTGISVFIERA